MKAGAVFPRSLLAVAAAILFAGLGSGVSAQADKLPVFVTDFTNPGISPSHWTLTLHPDGSGHFTAEHGDSPAAEKSQIDVPSFDRDIRLSPDFAARVFAMAKRHRQFNEKCESGLKVAFQGWKQLSYSGTDGQGSCRFNYSQDKEIQSLGDAMVAVAETLREGARLELLLQHDRLGLDQETEYLADAVRDGRVQQIGAIRDILTQLANDDAVLERVRKRARTLLARADK
jgi:hypothetical protein